IPGTVGPSPTRRSSDLQPGEGVRPASGWYGKRFDGPEDVHPLLFSAEGEVFAVDPRKLPVGVADRLPLGAVDRVRKALPVLRPALRTRKPRARLRDVEYRGKRSEEHTSELQSRENLVCRLLLEKKNRHN